MFRIISTINKTKTGTSAPNKNDKKDTKFGNKDLMVTHNSITKNTFVLSSKTSCRPTMLACFSLKKGELEC